MKIITGSPEWIGFEMSLTVFVISGLKRQNEIMLIKKLCVQPVEVQHVMEGLVLVFLSDHGAEFRNSTGFCQVL